MSYKNIIMKIKGEKGIAGIYQKQVISFKPVSEIKSFDLKKKVYKKKIGSIIKI